MKSPFPMHLPPFEADPVAPLLAFPPFPEAEPPKGAPIAPARPAAALPRPAPPPKAAPPPLLFS